MRYSLAPDVRRWSEGTVLLGGSPLRLLRLTASGRDTVDRLTSGKTVDLLEGAERTLADRLVRLGLLEPRPGVGEGPWTAADVTVVVPVHGRPERLADTLASIAKADVADRPGRVVVVDDGSVDAGAVAEVVARHGAELVRRDRSGGPAAARNTGLAAVRTPLVAFVDSDVSVDPAWLPWLIRSFADPRVALVAPRVIASGGSGVRARSESVRSPLDLGGRPGPIAARSRLAYVPAATIVCRVDALAGIGGFDESMPVGEDVDLCWRLADAGWLAWYAGDDAWVHHDDHDERRRWVDWARRRFDYGTSAAPLDRRHPGAVAPLGVSGWSVAAWVAAAAGHRVVGAAVVVGTSAALVRKLDVPDERVAVAGLALRGNLMAGELIGRALVRPWFPLTAVAALGSRRARRVAFVAAVVPPLLEWSRRRPALDPLRWTAIALADDVAYSAGVWVGALRERSTGALRPDLADWPGRTSPGPASI